MTIRGTPDLRSIPLIDHHCHGIVDRDLDGGGIEEFLTEGRDAAPDGLSHFDSPFGLAVRRWCSPVLDMNPFPTPEDYVARRRELGWKEVSVRLLTDCGFDMMLVDSGFRAGELVDVEAMGELAHARAREIVRIESIGESLASGGMDASEYPEAVESALAEAARGAVALKTVVAYRIGFDFDPTRPPREEVVSAAGRWLSRSGRSPARLDDPVLIRHVLHAAADLAQDKALPLQIHAGFGDPDLDLHRANPALLTDLIRDLSPRGVRVVFLHCYPYHREAGYLASMFENVYLDVSLALEFAGPSAHRLLAGALEVAPFTKQLFASDGFGIPERHHVGTVSFRRALQDILGGWIDRDECSSIEAEHVARAILHENALRIYPP